MQDIFDGRQMADRVLVNNLKVVLAIPITAH